MLNILHVLYALHYSDRRTRITNTMGMCSVISTTRRVLLQNVLDVAARFSNSLWKLTATRETNAGIQNVT